MTAKSAEPTIVSTWNARQIKAFVEDFQRRVPDAAWMLLGAVPREALISHEVLMIGFTSNQTSVPATVEELRQLRIDFSNRNALVRAGVK